MGISVVGKNVRGKVPTWRSFIADTEEDINILPIFPSVAYGSECFCTDNGNVYILEVNNNWVVKKESAAGSSLPEVTDADNGQVLTVVEGEWNKSEISSTLVVHFNWDEVTEQYVIDKTLSEINEAVNHGQSVVGVDMGLGSEGNYYVLTFANDFSANFIQLGFEGTFGSSYQYLITLDEETDEQSVQYSAYRWDVVDDT